eukprot:GHVS01061415.1.p1 GENE.GHVS01061415.1~~GHVS01061415.1.p1  ORF type:complete len:851 (-),score=187.49 GHVS01061415.1:206-2758(-)
MTSSKTSSSPASSFHNSSYSSSDSSQTTTVSSHYHNHHDHNDDKTNIDNSSSIANDDAMQCITYLGFNQDGSCLAVGTLTGFLVYFCFPLVELCRYPTAGPVVLVEMLFSSSLVAVVESGPLGRVREGNQQEKGGEEEVVVPVDDVVVVDKCEFIDITNSRRKGRNRNKKIETNHLEQKKEDTDEEDDDRCSSVVVISNFTNSQIPIPSAQLITTTTGNNNSSSSSNSVTTTSTGCHQQQASPPTSAATVSPKNRNNQQRAHAAAGTTTCSSSSGRRGMSTTTTPSACFASCRVLRIMNMSQQQQSTDTSNNVTLATLVFHSGICAVKMNVHRLVVLLTGEARIYDLKSFKLLFSVDRGTPPPPSHNNSISLLTALSACFSDHLRSSTARTNNNNQMGSFAFPSIGGVGRVCALTWGTTTNTPSYLALPSSRLPSGALPERLPADIAKQMHQEKIRRQKDDDGSGGGEGWCSLLRTGAASRSSEAHQTSAAGFLGSSFRAGSSGEPAEPGSLVALVDVDGCSEERRIRVHDAPVQAVVFNPAGTLLVTASTKGTILRIWSVPEMDRLWSFRRGNKCCSVYSLNFSLHSDFLVAVGSSNTLHVFKLKFADDFNSSAVGRTAESPTAVDGIGGSDEFSEGSSNSMLSSSNKTCEQCVVCQYATGRRRRTASAERGDTQHNEITTSEGFDVDGVQTERYCPHRRQRHRANNNRERTHAALTEYIWGSDMENDHTTTTTTTTERRRRRMESDTNNMIVPIGRQTLSTYLPEGYRDMIDAERCYASFKLTNCQGLPSVATVKFDEDTNKCDIVVACQSGYAYTFECNNSGTKNDTSSSYCRLRDEHVICRQVLTS